MQRIVSIEEACDYIPIDEPDTKIINKIDRLINTADLYLQGSIDKNYPKDDSRAQECALLIIRELYLNGSGSDSMTPNVQKLVDNFCLQIKLEMKRNGKG